MLYSPSVHSPQRPRAFSHSNDGCLLRLVPLSVPLQPSRRGRCCECCTWGAPVLGSHAHPSRCPTGMQSRSGRTYAVNAKSEHLADGRCQVYVTVDWLRKNLEDVAVVDVRGAVDTDLLEPGVESSTYRACRDDYLRGHIQGATFWDWTEDGLQQGSTVPVQLDLNPDTFAAAAAEKGIGSDRAVVVYDEGTSGSMFACRVWWALKVHGHDQVYVLEGGWRAWVAAQGAEELTEPCPLKVMADFDSAGMKGELRAELEEVVALQQQGGAQLLDVRSRQQFLGEVRRARLAGRMPGAVSLPFKELLDSEGALLGHQELVCELEGAGLDLSQRVVVYCNGGVSACVAATALQCVGHRQWSVYDGSWNEYGNCEGVAVEAE